MARSSEEFNNPAGQALRRYFLPASKAAEQTTVSPQSELLVSEGVGMRGTTMIARILPLDAGKGDDLRPATPDTSSGRYSPLEKRSDAIVTRFEPDCENSCLPFGKGFGCPGRCQMGLQAREIHGATVIRIDQTEIADFRPLVDVRNTRRRQLDQQLAQRIRSACRPEGLRGPARNPTGRRCPARVCLRHKR